MMNDREVGKPFVVNEGHSGVRYGPGNVVTRSVHNRGIPIAIHTGGSKRYSENDVGKKFIGNEGKYGKLNWLISTDAKDKFPGYRVGVELVGNSDMVNYLRQNGYKNLDLQARERKGDCGPSRGSELVDRS